MDNQHCQRKTNMKTKESKMAKELFDVLENINWSADDFSTDAFETKVKEYMGDGYEVRTWDINEEWFGDMVCAADAVARFVRETAENMKLVDIQTSLFQTNDLREAIYVVAIKAE